MLTGHDMHARGAAPDDSELREKVAQCATRTGHTPARLGEPMGHTLLSGPPEPVARLTEAAPGGLRRPWLSVAPRPSPPAAATTVPHHSPTELLLRLAELRNGDVLFIDEIHAIPRLVAEFLYEALVEGQLPEPFVAPFENREQLRYYDVPELTELIATRRDSRPETDK